MKSVVKNKFFLMCNQVNIQEKSESGINLLNVYFCGRYQYLLNLHRFLNSNQAVCNIYIILK